MKHIKGDLLKLAKEGTFDVIAHGCNCFCTMSAGIAKGVATCFPQAYEADRRTLKGDRAKLGTCTSAEIPLDRRTLVVVNAYTQYDFRGSGLKADYQAIRSCMQWIARSFPGKRIGLPRIGAGLGGGDWARIEAIIEKESAHTMSPLSNTRPSNAGCRQRRIAPWFQIERIWPGVPEPERSP